MRIALLASAGLAFGAGAQLFVGTEKTDRFFAWTIAPPLTAAFLGAAYWGALVMLVAAARERLWAAARIATIATLCLVPLLLLVTLVHIDRFHTDSDDTLTLVGTWIFITTYGWLPLLLVVALVYQLRAPGGDPPRTMPLPSWTRAVLAVHATLLGGVGLAFLIAPTATAHIWPWHLTPLTGRATGAWVVSVGVAAGVGVREADWSRIRVPLVGYVSLSVLEAVAIARYAHTPDWSHPGSWVIVAVLASMLALGLYGLLVGARRTPSLARG